MKEIFAKIYGNVQSVGFRQHTKKQAEKLGLVGWVENKADGSVECVAQGEEENLKKFASHLKRGPYFAAVDNAIIDWHDELQDELLEFEILE
ncbi:MAG: acylphosphatase [Candidatus Paceibacterota bacterium]